jgi:hypothetical protein
MQLTVHIKELVVFMGLNLNLHMLQVPFHQGSLRVEEDSMLYKSPQI